MTKSLGGGIIRSVSNGSLRIDYAKNRLLVSKNNIDKLLAGVDEDGEVRVKLAQDGIDVKTANNSQLIFNSDYNLLKIVATGEDTFPALDAASSPDYMTSDELDINTGVASSVPLIALAFYESGEDESIQLPFISTMSSGSYGGLIRTRLSILSYASSVTGNTHILIGGTNYSNLSNNSRTIHWYLLQESALPS